MKRLYRSKRYKMISGICGGIAEYFRMDPTIVRILYLAATILTHVFPGVILYIVLRFVIPINDSEDFMDV